MIFLEKLTLETIKQLFFIIYRFNPILLVILFILFNKIFIIFSILIVVECIFPLKVPKVPKHIS